MLALLKDSYSAHSLCSFDVSLDPDHYFVLRQGGEIIAGAQVNTLHWELLQLPGWQGWLATKLLPHVPLLGRDFTPADLRFARVGNLYALKGAEPMVSEILETVLAERRLPFAAVFADPRGYISLMEGKKVMIGFRHIIHTIDMHCAGEPARVVLSGLPDLNGETMTEKKADLVDRLDHFRELLMREPRGHAGMYGVVGHPANFCRGPGRAVVHGQWRFSGYVWPRNPLRDHRHERDRPRYPDAGAARDPV